MKSNAFAILALLVITSVQTACVNATRGGAATLNIYQASILRLPPSRPVQTLDGTYTPQTAETWHSDPRYRQLERAYLDQLAARGAPSP